MNGLTFPMNSSTSLSTGLQFSEAAPEQVTMLTHSAQHKEERRLKKRLEVKLELAE